ncbi:MAG: N-acetylmuramoyl-L-alanine amidase, partial [Cyclobacteriaceae bacterium]
MKNSQLYTNLLQLRQTTTVTTRIKILLIAITLLNLSATFRPVGLPLGSTGFKLETIVIDPGHGGRDPGTSGKKTKEKDIAL